ncbi:MAG TPA: rhodanese-like domain-containing protein [Gaiellaceae bacterium]|nr:rhodanese-like domain-containing protein [Gaiellaceae bacterium]
MTATVSQSDRVSTAELRARLGEPGLCVVDARPLPAFNGWRVEGDARGGHVPGAVAFPAGWLSRLDDAELRVLLQSKGISTSGEVVVYGGRDAAALFRSRVAEHTRVPVRVYDAGYTEWCEDPAAPVERLARHTQLVHPAWLAELLAGGTPEAAPTGKTLLLHVNFGAPEEYADSHLPGAIYLDTNVLESPSDWNRRPPEDLDAALRMLGVTTETCVILYGRDTEGGANEKWPGRRAGQIAATRAALILSYCGVRDVRVLDGGYDAWVQAGGALETVARMPASVPAFGASIPQRPELIVDIDDAKRILADREGAALVSVRTWREQIGETSGYNYIGAAGRIAGDVWGNCGTDAYHMQHYRNIDNTMRPYPEIAANWADAGITADKWVAFYCGTGWRASETWFYAHLQGWPRIAVYDGGWWEWSRDPASNPVEVGEPA